MYHIKDIFWSKCLFNVETLRQEGLEDPKPAHLIFVGPFKDHNKKLHTNTQSSRCCLNKRIFMFSLNKPI